MENVMKNGFAELSVVEIEEIDGGKSAVYWVSYYVGKGAKKVANAYKTYVYEPMYDLGASLA
ncbi:MAG: hypothetical protein IJY19_07250 [Ruminococcus sp.]|nr:hypothetical protein [Ruminococcus sp.]